MSNTIIRFLLALSAAALCAGTAGCVRHGYGDGTDVNFVRSDTGTLTDLTRTTQKMVDRLCGSPAFRRQYGAAEERDGGRLPVIQVGNFENLVVPRKSGEDVRQYTPRLEICRAKAREALQDSGLFRIVDDSASFGSDTETLNRGVESDIDVGMVEAKNLRNVGAFTAADFRMLGSLRREHDGDSFYFVLEIRIYDLATREQWTATEILEKWTKVEFP